MRRAGKGRRIGQRKRIAYAAGQRTAFGFDNFSRFADLIIAEPSVRARVEPCVKHLAHARVGRCQYAALSGQQIRRRIQTGDADKGRIKRRRQTLRHACSDTQTGKRAGALCIDDHTQIRRRNTRLFK